jgi:hypothetical protein
MIHAPLALLLFWAFAAFAAIGAAVAVLAGSLKPDALLTKSECKAALQLIGIVVLGLTIIYYQNGHSSDRATFIYGRF